MKNSGETEVRKMQSPINVPVICPSVSAYTAALHMSFIALVLMASIFVVAFATFNSANAFNMNRDAEFGNSSEFLDYNFAGNKGHKLGLVADPAEKRILPNVEETAFNSVIFSKGISQIRQIQTKTLAPVVHHNAAIETEALGTSLSSTTRYSIAAVLGGIFAFMIWITTRMWREFAGRTRQS